ncbi:MAG TPA: protein kinase, partial [Myxococcales bacterium]|nr:protein kinase [Myxococcales bacterium]
MSKTDEMVPPGPGPEAAGPARIDERYRIDKEIGRGGMGRVFVAHDRKLGRDVAIKVLASGLHGEEALRRFEQEARATCALSHANILDVHDIGTHD